MKYPAVIFASFMLFTQPVLAAELTGEERCVKQGEVAEKAASMRVSGVDKDTATKTLTRMYDRPDSGVTANNVRGMVMVSYMTKMKPEKMRDYAIKECKKNILK